MVVSYWNDVRSNATCNPNIFISLSYDMCWNKVMSNATRNVNI